MTRPTRRHVACHEVAHALGAAASASGIREIRILPASGRPFRVGFNPQDKSEGVFQEYSTRVGCNDGSFIALCGWAWEMLYGNELYAAEDFRIAAKRLAAPMTLDELQDTALDFVRMHTAVIEETGAWVDCELAGPDGKMGKRKMDALYKHLQQRLKSPYSRSSWRQCLVPCSNKSR